MWRVDGVQALDLFSVQQAGAHTPVYNYSVRRRCLISSDSQVLSNADCKSGAVLYLRRSRGGAHARGLKLALVIRTNAVCCASMLRLNAAELGAEPAR